METSGGQRSGKEILAVPTFESAAAEENRMMRSYILEMLDSWNNGKEPPSTIPGFPEVLPRADEISNIPKGYSFTPQGHPATLAHIASPSDSHPHMSATNRATNLYVAPPCPTVTQPTIPRPNYESSSFTFQAPTPPLEPTRFPANAYLQPPQYKLTLGQSQDPRMSERDEMDKRIKSLEQSLRDMRGLSGPKGVSYADLCVFLHVHLPAGFKTPKFVLYDGHGDPVGHLKKYCNQLRGVGGREELLIGYFEESLIGITSEWYMDQDISRWHIWDDLARDFIRQFQYNVDIAPDQNALSNLKKKPSEGFREYAIQWRKQASRVKPPIDEKEMVSVFLQAQELDYYQNMMSAMGKPFVEVIKIGKMAENRLKTGRLLSQAAIRATSQAIQGGSGGITKGKKKEESAMAASGAREYRKPKPHFAERAPQHYYPHQDTAYTPQPQENLLQPVPQNRQNPNSLAYQRGIYCAYHSGAEGHNIDNCWTLKKAVQDLINQERIVFTDEDAPNVTNNPLLAHNNRPIIGMICKDREFDPALKAIVAIADAERPKAALRQEKKGKEDETIKNKVEEKKETAEADPGKAKMTAPRKSGVLYLLRGRPEMPLVLSAPKKFQIQGAKPMSAPREAYVTRGTIKLPRLDEPVFIGRVPQKPMTDPTTIPWNYNRSVMTYKGKEITGESPVNAPVRKYSDIREVSVAARKRFPLKVLVTIEEAEAFFHELSMLDCEVVYRLRENPEQVSMLSLLTKSVEHQKVLMRTLNEAYVPAGTLVEQLERMAERFFGVNQISFSKADLPPEGAAHNKALHLTVKYEGYYVKRVMVDGGSGVDICPLSTLQRMEIQTSRIRSNNVCVRVFDGIKRETLGEIDLTLGIGPVEFEVTFQVLDMDTSYNFLLGRPWIYAAGAVPYTLHQMVKFEHEDQEIVVHGEDEHAIYRDPSIPYLAAREGSEHIVYQAFDIVMADQYEEGSPCPQPCLSNVSIMVAKEMLRHGFQPGKGLGKSLQGIPVPITLPTTEKFFGLGFHPSPQDEAWADERKGNGWVLPQPLPHLYQTFVRPKYDEEEEDEAFTEEEIEDICGAMRQMLYDVHMVQSGEGTSTAEVQYVEPNAKLQNWKATPFPTRRESW
uniref:G-patch domain-containing protein n=1 Tax=Nicotiana tabacum TaxID=4097 RepID=A0A1S3X9D7_TOBAC|nr:PREDICTED: uncharacterized protein LOC107762657 [Nicotiana tabacum]